MTEPEVSLRLAMYYLRNGLTKRPVEVSIDGAHVKTGDNIWFDIKAFLGEHGFSQCPSEVDRWQGRYFDSHDNEIAISSVPGKGDVVAYLEDGNTAYVESKKSKEAKSSQEYPLMREAIGQLLTGEDVPENAIPIVAVPKTNKSVELAQRWSKLPLFKKTGIQFALICEDGSVDFI